MKIIYLFRHTILSKTKFDKNICLHVSYLMLVLMIRRQRIIDSPSGYSEVFSSLYIRTTLM